MSKEPQTCADDDVMVRPIQVDVYAYREGDDVLFAQVWRLEGDSTRRKGHIEVAKGDSDVPIMFHLHDKSGLNLAFLPKDEGKQAGPFWCSKEDCPTSWGDGDGQMSGVDSSNKLLKIVDANSGDPCTLHYALRFSGDPIAGSGPPYVFDPEIRNGGGSVGGGTG